MLKNRDRLIFLTLFVGFVIMAIEIKYEHKRVLDTEAKSWIPIYYSWAAVVASLLGAFFVAKLRWVLATVYVVGIGVAAVGFWFHLEKNKGDLGKLFAFQPTIAHAQESEEEEAPIEDEGPVIVYLPKPPPILAPLGIAGLATIGLLLCVLRPKETVLEE